MTPYEKLLLKIAVIAALFIFTVWLLSFVKFGVTPGSTYPVIPPY